MFRSTIDALVADKANIDELVIATSSALARTGSLSLEEEVSTQTDTLIRFTKWLIALTVGIHGGDRSGRLCYMS